MKKNIYRLGLAASLLFATAACTDLELQPRYDQTPEVIYSKFENYKPILAKLYGGLALTGQTGPAGNSDIAGIDEGYSHYLRLYWGLQELPTDEAVIAWNDKTIQDLHEMDWNNRDVFITGMYARIFFQIPQINAFLRETTDEKLAERGISAANQEEIRTYRAEARFLRALSYWHALDLFGSVSFVTEADDISKNPPRQISKEDLFAYIESELKDIEDDLMAPGQNEYARVDQTAAWMLLSKLYLNAETYIGEGKYADVITYSNKIINSGLSLDPNYRNLFLADNHTAQGVIFPVAFDGSRTQTYGGTTFIINAATGGTMKPSDYGGEAWGGLRTTKEFVSLFPGGAQSADNREMFYVSDDDPETPASLDQTLEIDDITVFTNGYAVTKFRNITSDGQQGSSTSFADTDFPLFRLADAYLMYAEAFLRGGGGDQATAVGLINQLRERAYGDDSGNIAAADLNLDFILAERGRELYWEGHRRTDLIRFNKFTSDDYLWAWKGGVKEGKIGIGAHRSVYPIPAADLIANPNLKPTPGY